MLLCGAAQAEWTATTQDDGSFYLGQAGIKPQSGGPWQVELFCGGRSPQGLDPLVTGNVEPSTTKPGELGLYIAPQLIGEEGWASGPRTDVMIVIGQLGYRLPALRGNELVGVWEQFLRIDDPLIAALKSGQPMELRAPGRAVPLAPTGAAGAIDTMLRYCAGKSGAPAQTGLQAAVDAHIFQGCRGAATATPDYLLRGDLDRDGQQDLVLDWNHVTCPGAMARPFCGTANCSVDVFVSSAFARKGRPEQFLGIAPTLRPDGQGGLDLVMSGSAGICQGRPVCQHYRWDGAAFRALH